eukprot:jgi/Tetstr1/443674/TSEL_031665.t1
MADTLQALRESEFHRSTTLALDAHPFVSDAESGNLSAKRLTALALEQLSVVACDLKSFRHLAGTCQADGSKPAATKFFSMLADGEEAASGKLSCMLSWLGVTPKEQAAYTWQMEAQAYPSYMARCAHYGSPAAISAACAVNFPTWGEQCRRIHASLLTVPGCHGDCTAEDVAFLEHFATPIPGLDDMAIACLEEDKAVTRDEVVTVTRLLQACELMFWDSVYYKHKR